MNEQLKQDIIDYLNAVRESGKINMFGAVPFIMSEFNLDKKPASAHLSDWMQNFSSYQKV